MERSILRSGEKAVSEPYGEDLTHLQEVGFVYSPALGWTWKLWLHSEIEDESSRVIERAVAYFPTRKEAEDDYYAR